MSATVADISAADWSPKLGSPGEVVENLDDISQCIRVILETRKGSRAHEPLFGCDAWQFLDRPFSDALPYIVTAIIEAVEEWEPRAQLISIIPTTNEIVSGHITLQITWQLKDYDAGIQQTEVTL